MIVSAKVAKCEQVAEVSIQQKWIEKCLQIQTQHSSDYQPFDRRCGQPERRIRVEWPRGFKLNHLMMTIIIIIILASAQRKGLRQLATHIVQHVNAVGRSSLTTATTSGEVLGRENGSQQFKRRHTVVVPSTELDHTDTAH